jgi:nitroreductase
MIESNQKSALDVIKKRRSVRDFDDRIVPDDIVREIIQAAIWAPTSCNMQLNHFVIVNDPELLEKLKKPVTGKINWCKQMAVLLVDPKITHENKANYISAGMVVQNFLLRATDLGVSTCPIAGFKGKDILRRELSIPKRFDIPLLIFFGYQKQDKSKVKINIPFRLPLGDVYSYNRFDGKTPFPTTSCARNWDQQEIFDYRQRIMSVYFSRFGHSIWGKQYTDIIWNYIEEYLGVNKRILYIFPWEKGLLDKMSQSMSISSFDIADANANLIEFTRYKYNKVSKLLDLNNPITTAVYDVVVMVGSMEFNKDMDMLVKYSADALKEGGLLLIASTRKSGLIGIILQLLGLAGKQKDVYHNSLFYKLGPRNLTSLRKVKNICEKIGCINIKKSKNINTRFVESKIKSKLLLWLVKVASVSLPETKLYVLQKSETAFKT